MNNQTNQTFAPAPELKRQCDALRYADAMIEARKPKKTY